MKNKSMGETSISQVRSLKEISEFWDTHSLADYAPVYKRLEAIAQQRERIQRAISFPLAAFDMAIAQEIA